jgi:hypothetical protein
VLLPFVIFSTSCPALRGAATGAATGAVTGRATASASVSAGATVNVPDPPPNNAPPVDDLRDPAPKLRGCARGDVSAELAIVNDFRDSCHEMIICGGLNNQFGVSIVGVLLSAALGKKISVGKIEYKGNGTYVVGDVMVMTLVLGRDTSWGKRGDVIPFNVLDVSSYFVKASLKAEAYVDVGTGEARTRLAASFESAGPGIELLGLGDGVESGVSFDFHEVARTLAGGIEVSNVITVDDKKGDSHIAYKLQNPGMSFGELLGHAPQKMNLVDVSATRGKQNIEVTNWGMQFQPGSSGTLDGSIDFVVRGGAFDYVVRFNYPHRKDPDISLRCL